MNRFRWDIIVVVIIIFYSSFEAIVSLSEGRMVRVALAITLSLAGVVHLLTTIGIHDQ